LPGNLPAAPACGGWKIQAGSQLPVLQCPFLWEMLFWEEAFCSAQRSLLYL